MAAQSPDSSRHDGAVVQVGQHLGALAAAEDPQRELGQPVRHRCASARRGRAVHSVASVSSTSAARSRSIAVRIRVFAVPSGIDSLSAISRAVRP